MCMYKCVCLCVNFYIFEQFVVVAAMKYALWLIKYIGHDIYMFIFYICFADLKRSYFFFRR